jgi:3-isopropylmalate/(R)-2-methylmalate dehydratase small subunit
MIIRGVVAWKFGDNVTSDSLVQYPRYKHVMDYDGLRRLCMNIFGPEFEKRINLGSNILVAGRNFGSGHVHVQTHHALKAVGIKAVIAESFNRMWFRTAISLGLPLLSCPNVSKEIDIDEYVEINLKNGTVTNLSKNKTLTATPLPDFLIEVLERGGTINYLRDRFAILSAR